MTTLVYTALFNFADNFPVKHQHDLVEFQQLAIGITCIVVLRLCILTQRLLSFVM
jgi:hypothetical protein